MPSACVEARRVITSDAVAATVGAAEERVYRDIHAHGVPQPRDEPGGLEAVAAKVEEAVVYAYRRDAEHLRPRAGQGLLERRSRRHVGHVQLGPRRRRLRQAVAVDLSSGGAREDIEEDIPRRRHVGRHPLGERPRAPWKP